MRSRTHPRFETDLANVQRRTQVRPSKQAVTSPANLFKSGFAFSRVPRLYTVPQVAVVLNVSTRTVRRLIADEKLATVRIGCVVRIREDVLIGLIEDGVI
jgi:excisionase family DNA binding protein